jgi:ABC-type uncharacterized transport system substrate-binding protein
MFTDHSHNAQLSRTKDLIKSIRFVSHRFLIYSFITLLKISFVTHADASHRIFWLDSYDTDNPWAKNIGLAIQDTFTGYDVDLKAFHMDTKRYNSEQQIQRAARKAVAEIKAYQPDVVIASDDNASKYVVMPFFKNASLPVVFCGVNHAPNLYGYPYRNATGIIEVDPFLKLMHCLSFFCPVHKLGYLAEDGNSARLNGFTYKIQSRFECVQYYVSTFEQWKDSFVRAQTEVDVLIIGNTSAIRQWDHDKAMELVMRQTRIPTGCLLEFLSDIALISCIKLPEEQGRWAAQTALKIIQGTAPDSIKIATPRNGKLIVNTKIAESNGIRIPRSFLKKADKLIIN